MVELVAYARLLEFSCMIGCAAIFISPFQASDLNQLR